MHGGLYDVRWYGYGSYGTEPMRHLCGWIWRFKCWWIEWVCGMRSRIIQEYSW